MKVIIFMAVSLNGIIATEDFQEEFLLNENLLTSIKLAKESGCIVWGRTTYEEVRKWEDDFFLNNLKDVKKIVVSSKTDLKLDEGFIMATSPEDAIRIASEMGLNQILVSGGGTINSSFIKAGLVNEIMLNINPVVVGKGIKVFSDEDFEDKLELLDLNKLDKDIIQLHYKINQ